MRNLSFETKVKSVAILSVIQKIAIVLIIIGTIMNGNILWRRSLLLYMMCCLMSNTLLKCPKCGKKLSKGKYTFKSSECENCKHDLKNN